MPTRGLDRRPGSFRTSRDLTSRRRQGELKSRSMTRLARHPKVSTVRANNIPCNGQSQAHALSFAAAATAIVFLKDPIPLIVRYSRTGILDSHDIGFPFPAAGDHNG